MDCYDDKKNAQNKPLVYEIDTGRRQRVQISFLYVIIKPYLFSCFEILFNFLIKKRALSLSTNISSSSVQSNGLRVSQKRKFKNSTPNSQVIQFFLLISKAMTPTTSRTRSRFTKSSRQILTLYDWTVLHKAKFTKITCAFCLAKSSQDHMSLSTIVIRVECDRTQ
jgi:hypothetical protein